MLSKDHRIYKVLVALKTKHYNIKNLKPYMAIFCGIEKHVYKLTNLLFENTCNFEIQILRFL